MYVRPKEASPCAMLLVLAGSFAFAAEIDLELEVGIGQTDNITRANDTTADPAMDDVVYSTGLALMLTQDSARANVDLRGSLFYHGYKDGPYDDQTLPALDLSSIFRITEQALSWFLIGNIGQQSVDPFQPVTPGNRENVTYFTTGPRLRASMGPRFFLRTDLYYSRVTYEVQPIDNSRTGAQLSLVRQINPNRSLSLNLNGERTEFDEDALYAPIDRLDGFLQFETEGSRNEITIDLGLTRIERSGEEAEEPLATIDWRREMSAMSSLLLSVGTRVSDAAQNFRDIQQNSGDIGDVQNQQNLSVPFREDFAGLAFTIGATRTDFTLGWRWASEDYPEAQSQQNREVQYFQAFLARRLGRSWEIGLNARYDSRDYETLSRKDELIDLGARLTWNRLRTVEIELRFDRFEQESTEPSVEFVENRAYLGFRYIPQIGQ